MPPFGFRKRERSASPAPPPKSNKRAAAAAKPSPKKGKPTLFESADAAPRRTETIEEKKKFLDGLDDEGDSSASEVDSDDFEDVPPAKRRKMGPSNGAADEDEDEDDEDEMDWQDAVPVVSPSAQATPSASKTEDEIGDISISVKDDGSYIEPLISAATGKKGPSKRERQIRVQTHCLHVMALMWHNTVRNSWLNDKEVQRTLVAGLPEGLQREVRKWKDAMCNVNGGIIQDDPKPASIKSKGKGRQAKKIEKSEGRDWNTAAQSQATTNDQATNALLRLLKVLTAYWRKRFTVTAPGLRKQGYKDLRRLRNEIKAWEKNRNELDEYGERIESVGDFRQLAKKCEGSRDTGNQLFAALLRGLGMQVRMVANLQPAGIGWSKAEEAYQKKDKKQESKTDDTELDSEDEIKSAPSKASSSKTKKPKERPKQENPTRRSSRGNKSDPIDLDASDSPLSSLPSDLETVVDDDDISVIDVTPAKRRPSRKYDRDLAFPNYWTEVCDPVSLKVIPIDPIVLSTIASNDELLQTFEPRGKKAENAKQVICYTLAFSSDGTAKDVTVRYLKRHQLPGKTKGVRMPAERIPIYNRKGKVKRYEDYDWFRTLMLVYNRPEAKRTLADDFEDGTDLKPFKPEKQEKTVEKESLQGYKQSADFVLEQHLRREEALLPGAQPVKTFTAGKGDKVVEHPVYLRSNVVACKTVESWHKEGRAIKMGEQPLKYVPMRAVTLVRKREIEDAQRETGEKLKQGLYSEAQTEWIIPPPIENGVIPRNAFGNMDVYVPTMVPEGAVHLPLKGTAKICRKLEIDYAEACTGFEFGKQRAVPILTGVVVAAENERLVRDAWRVQREEEKRKEDTKRTATALHCWRKMLLGLRVLERMRVEYADAGGTGEEVNPFVRRAVKDGRIAPRISNREAVYEAEDGGGFLLPGDEDQEAIEHSNDFGAGGFLVEDEDYDTSGSGFLVDEKSDPMPNETNINFTSITPVSLPSIHMITNGATNSDEEIASITEAIPEKKPQERRRNPKLNGEKKTARIKVVVSSDEESPSEASAPSDALLDDAADESNDDDAVPAPAPPRTTKGSARKGKQTSPQVVVSPVKKTPTSSSHSKSARSARATRATKKSTPVRSPYFNHWDEIEDQGDSDDGEDEVVEVRRTTKRTRSKA